jgi:dolichol-phosphate mannosyltransferase
MSELPPAPAASPHAGMPSVDARPEAAAPIVVVLPTYNELDNLRRLAPELLGLPVGLQVIVVDDNSPDGTGALADKLAAAEPERLSVIHRAGKLGLGTAYVAGFKLALSGPAGAVLTMDADYSHHPEHIAAMASKLAGADLVIGSRYVPGGKVVDSPLARRLLSRGANTVAHVLLGLHARDVTAGFRLYRREVLATLPLDSIFSSGYSFLIELLYMVERRGWRVAETPITFRDRAVGQSKISRAEIGRALYTVLRLSYRRLRRR